MNPVVHVLLATLNGERHLAEQWASLEAQQRAEVVVHVADDGSSDGSVALLERLAAQCKGAVKAAVWLRQPPRRSATRSFLLLLQQALDCDPAAAWFAFCDQDDVWLPDKLSAALAVLADSPPARPCLYGGRTLSIDEQGREIGLSPLFTQAPDFRNALVQSIIGGNTIVMNRSAALLVVRALAADITAHDWFAYQIVAGAGGLVRYDPHAYVLYRQHAANVVGGNQGLRARWRRFVRVLRGDYGRWNDQHVAALRGMAGDLTDANRLALEAFSRARLARSPLARLAWLRRSRVFRQPVVQQASLWTACLLGRI